MARTKQNKGKQGETNTSLVRQLKTLIDNYLKHENPSDESEAKKAIQALDAYAKATSPLTDSQLTSEVNTVIGSYKGNSREQRRAVRRKAGQILDKVAQQKSAMKAHQQKVQDMQGTQAKLLSDYNSLADKLTKVTTSSNLLDYDELYAQYKEAQQSLLTHANDLKDMLSGEAQDTQKQTIGDIQARSHEINEHTRAIDTYRAQAKARIQQATLKAAEASSQMTVGQFLQ